MKVANFSQHTERLALVKELMRRGTLVFFLRKWSNSSQKRSLLRKDM